MKKTILKYVPALLSILFIMSCQKMDTPSLGEFPTDANEPGGPLSFYVAFDGTSDDPLRNAVDSIRANFAAENPYSTIDGVSGKAVRSVDKKFIKYQKPNDWATASKSFTVAIWYKKNGQTKNNAGGNGPEYLVSFRSNNGHWAGANFFLFLEGNNAGCAVKSMVVDKNMADTWFTWEGGDVIPGLVDNQWHHLALVYDAAASKATLYIDGVADARTRTWGTHGDVAMSDAHISEVRVGAGPGTNYDGDDWLSSSWKGDLDQLRMYSVALSAAEIKALYDGKK